MGILGLITYPFYLLFYVPPLLFFRLIGFFTLAPIRLSLLPLRVFYAIASTIYDVVLSYFSTFETIILYTVAPLVGAIAGIGVHFISRLLAPTAQSNSSTTESTPEPVGVYPGPKSQDVWSTPKQVDTYRTLEPPVSVESTPTSPLDALLPPDSPLLARNHHAASSTEQTQGRPAQARNLSYRTQMRSLMTERQEQLLALHEEEKRRRATQELSSPTIKAHTRVDDGSKTKSEAAYGSLVTPSKSRHARSTSLPMFAIIQENGDTPGTSIGSYRNKSPSSVHTASAGAISGFHNLIVRPDARTVMQEIDGQDSFSDC